VLRRVRRAIDAVVQRARFERDLRDELHQHLDARTRDLVDGGLSPADAARQARLEFGAIERYKELCRDERGFAAFRPFHGLGADVRLAARRLAATPQFVVFAVVSLGIGIGATTSVHSILNSLSTRVAVAEPERTAFIASPGSPRRARLSDPDFDDLRNAQHSFQYLGASASFVHTLAEPSRSEIVLVEAVSEDYWAAVGTPAAIGRVIQPQDVAARAPVLVLSDRLWRTRFDADPSVVGRVVRLGGHPFEVIGVSAAGFDGLSETLRRSAAWVPLTAMSLFESGRPPAGDPREWSRLDVIGVLRPGVTVQSADAEMRMLARRFDAAAPLRGVGKSETTSPRPWSARLVNTTEGSNPVDVAQTMILALIGLVLVVACLNLANLMLARGTARQREFAVRRALGASRWRLVREICAESAIVAVLGGIVGLLLVRAVLSLSTIEISLPGGTLAIEPRLDATALAATAIALLLSLAVFGLEPALELTRGSVRGDLSGGDAAIGVPRSGRQRAFIRWQVAISATFLLVAAILAKVVVAELRHDSGVELDRLAVAVVPLARDWEEARSRRVLTRAAEHLRQHGMLETVAVSSGVPFGMTATPFANVTTANRPFTPSHTGAFAFFLSATPEVFSTLGVRIIRGRGFDQRDDLAAARVMVISEKTARDLFGPSDPLGRRVLARNWGRPPDLPFEVIGVSADTDAQSLMSRTSGVVYVPMAQHFEPRIAMILARTSGDPAMAARLIQNALRQVEPDVAAATAGAASVMLAGAHVVARVGAILATAMGLLTLVLAMVGLYGIQSHLVAQRTREVGVRMALGAARRQIELMMLRQGYRPVVEGILLGLFFGAVVRTIIRAYVNAPIQPIDPVAFTLVPIPLILAALIACYAPARRASRVDPNEALRHL
jgi:predicted permease